MDALVKVCILESELSQHVSTLFNQSVFILHSLLKFLVVTIDREKTFNQLISLSTLSFPREFTQLLKLLIRHSQKLKWLIFNLFSRHAIFSIQKLQKLLLACSYSAIILNHHIFKSLDQSSTYIPSFSCLNRSINQTFSTTHRVEVKFLRVQPTQVRRLNKSFRLRSKVILRKMRQSPSIKAEGYTTSFNILLANTSHNLTNVDVRAFRPS